MKELKKELKKFKKLPLPFLGLKSMEKFNKKIFIPTFETDKHQSEQVPRKIFYKPISKMW